MSASIQSLSATATRVALAMLVTIFTSGTLFGQSGTWTSAAPGDYFTAPNWQGGTVASGVGNTADFSTVDLTSDITVTVDSALTIGGLNFADANPANGTGIYDFFTTNASVITLDNSGSAPLINVGSFTPGAFDDVFIGNNLAGASGFNKTGSGIFTIGGDATALTGPINVNEGTLRIGPVGAYAGAAAPITIADGATIESQVNGGFFGGVSVASGATGTVRFAGSGSNFLNQIQSDGTGTLNLESGTAGATISGEGDWATGGGFAEVNMTGTDSGGVSFFRGRINRPAPNNWNADFTNTVVNLDNIDFRVQTNSFGNNVAFGELNGTGTAVLTGGNAGSGGSAIRYIIGALNTDGEFAGTVVGGGGPTGNNGGVSIEKVGTGTHTFSGTFVDPLVGANADIGREGGVIRVSAGTLAFTGTADSVPGGFGTRKSTIDVLTGATLDVSGTTNTFSSSPLQQIQGSGTIVGPFNHDEGEIRPADVSTADNDTTLTNEPVPTVGSINFTGNLTFNGGSIVYDMNETPGINDLIQVNGMTSVSGGGVVDPNFLGADPTAGLTYTFLTSSGGFSDAVSGWTVNWPGRGAKPDVFIDGNDLKFTTTEVGAGGAVVWSGAVNGTWDVETTQNWLLGGSADVFFQGDDVTFNDSGANPTITLSEAVNPRNMVVNSNTNAYSFSGNSIIATGTLTKSGSSTLTLGATNEFTSVTIDGGTIDTGAASGVLGTGPLTMSGGSIINAGTSSITNSSIEVTTGTTNSLQFNGSGGPGGRPGIPTLTGGGDLNVTITSDSSWANLGNTTGFTGSLTVGPGGGAVTLGNLRTAGAATQFAGASLTLNSITMANQNGGSGEITTEIGELNGDAAAALNGFVGGSTTIPNINWQIGDLNTDSTFAGVIVDGGGGGGSVAVSRVTKVGTGTLSLTGPSTYTGDTTVEDGTLSITSAFLADTANVFIDGDAVFELLFSGNDDINFLYLDGEPQAPGIYNAANSGGLITGTGGLNVLELGPELGLAGDFNGDGVVDSIDYAVWRENLGAADETALNGNGDGLNGVDSADFDLWQANYGASDSAASSVVATPEPAGLAIACLLFAGLAARRRAQT